MTISIWILFVIIAGTGFWFAYKKYNRMPNKTIIPKASKNTKYALSDIDRMLEHITRKEKSEDGKPITDKEYSNVQNEKKANSKSVETEKPSINIKEGILASVILKKKDDL